MRLNERCTNFERLFAQADGLGIIKGQGTVGVNIVVIVSAC
jgi:hypothetical protein